MADFGWAFVKGNLTTGSAPPSGAVQYNDGSNKFAASSDLVFVSGATSQLNLTGNLDVVGNVSASLYYGDGSNLTGVGGTPGGSDTQLQFNSGSTFSGSSNLTYDYTTNTLTLSGTLNISGALATNELIINVENRNVTNISATGSTRFGDSTDDTHVFTGSMSISGASNPLNLKGLQIGTLPNTSSYLAIDSSNNVILTPVSNGVIGEAEDGDYTDGLFADFLASTPIGTAIDKINEILKIIVPGPAPAVDRINYTNTSGIGLKIGEAGPGYFGVSNTGSYNDSLGVSSEYSSSTSGEDFRLGTYDGSQEITGTINFHVSEQLKSTEINYSNNAFGNAESGLLKLYVNGALAHTLDLDGFVGTGSPNSGSATDFALGTSTGFIEISTTAPATDQNGSEYDIFQHRTAKFVVDTLEQRDGWNIAKVEHEYGGTTYITNFVQWYNDPDASSQAMAAQNQSVAFTGHGPAKYLSGVEYYRSGTLEYTAEATNFYKYTYPTGSVLTFNKTSNLSPIAAQTPADIGAIDVNALVRMTASAETNNDVMLNDSATISFNLTHPFKTNLSAVGSVTTNGILIYNVDTASSNLVENFDDETYRITNKTYSLQSDVSTGTWDSQNHMTSSGATGHTDGLLFYNGKLYSPNQGANSGDFSTLANGPASNPDYSSTTGTRTFFRKIQNLTGVTKYDLKISSTKNTKINNTTLTTDNVKFYIKLPGTSGWMDISQNFSYGNISDGDGALISGASDNSNTGGTSTSNAVHCVTFGTAPVLANQYVVIKIEADSSWTKYIDSLTFQFGATDVSDAISAPPLDDIDLADTAGVDANLSFGTSNTLTDYSNVTGSSIDASLSTVNINGLYSDNGDTRRGVFGSFEAMGGTLNQDVGASGQNYTADSFFNGYAGSLVLEVNGTEVSSIDLTSTLSTINNISTDTGFSVSAVSFSKTSDLIPDYNKPYRTGTYSIGVSLQNNGWNYARVIHRVAGLSDTETNYVEWVVDPSGSTSMSFSNVSLTNFDHTDVYYQSGIGYFASRPTGSYSYVLSGAYSNVYSNDSSAISFPTTTNCSITNIDVNGDGVTNKSVSAASTSYPALDAAVPGCESMDIQVTGTVLFDSLTSIIGDPSIFTSRDATISSRALHPLKSLVNVSSQTKSDFMVFSGSLGSTNLNTQEYFGLETYRVVSGNYANQSDVTSSSNAWDSTISMNDTASYAEYADGMVTIDGYAITPLRIGNNGDTRNVSDGGVAQAPSGNPDYSTLNENIRTYYRYFRNETGLAKATFTVTLYGDANLISKSGAFYTGTLGANKNIQVELKVPYDPAFTGLDDTSTAWGDCIKPYELGTQPTSDGVGIFNGGGGDLNQTVGSGGTSVAIQLQGSQVRDDQYYVLKISAHKDWTGYLSRIAITY